MLLFSWGRTYVSARKRAITQDCPYLFQRHRVPATVDVFSAAGRVVSDLPVLGVDLERAAFDGEESRLVNLDVLLAEQLHFQQPRRVLATAAVHHHWLGAL